MVKRTHQTIWIVFALFVAYLVVVRLVITWAQFAPSQFTTVVEAITESDISFETLNIEQNWLGIELEAQDLLVEHDGLELEARRVALDFNLFSPFMPQAPWGDYLVLEQLALLEYSLKPAEQGSTLAVDRWLTFDTEQITSQFDISRLWKRVEITDFSAALYQAPDTWEITVDSFQAFKGARWSLAADFNLHYGQALKGERFQFKASILPGLLGNIKQGDFTVKAYDSIRLERLVRLLPEKWHDLLPAGELIPNIKGTFANSLLSTLNVELTTPGLIWPEPNEDLPKSIGLNLEWQNQTKIYDGSQTNWQFLLSQIQLDNHFVQTVSPVQVQLVSQQFLHIETEKFDISPFKPIFHSILRNENVAQLFAASVELSIDNVIGDLDIEQLYFKNLSMDVSKLAVPVTNLPGLAIENLHIEKSNTHFEVSSAKPIWVMHPLIHDVPMRFDLQSNFVASLDVPKSDWTIETFDVLWDDMPLNLTANGNFSGKLNVESSLEPKTVNKVKQYLPYSIMSPKLESWLKTALRDGENVKGQFFFHGDLNDYPFVEGTTRFGGTVDLQNAGLKFQPNWPTLTGFDARLDWSQFKLTINAEEANLYEGLNARDIEVVVDDLHTKNIAVELSAKAKGEGDLAISYLTETPLPGLLGIEGLLADKKKLKLAGAVDVDLKKVWIPVYGFNNQTESVTGSVHLEAADLTIYQYLDFKQVAGSINFTEKAVSGQNLKAVFEGGDARFNITTKGKNVTVSGKGQVALDYPSIVNGQANWNSTVHIPLKSNGKEHIVIDTSIDSGALNWLMPAPLNNETLTGKSAAKLIVLDESVNVVGHVGGLGLFDVDLNTTHEMPFVSGGVVQFGEAEVKEQAKSEGVNVSGQLKQVELDGWLKWDSGFGNKSHKPSFLQNTVWRDSELFIDEVKLFERGYSDFQLEWAGRAQERLDIKLLSKDISATIQSDRLESVKVNLDWLQLYLPEKDANALVSKQKREQWVQSCKTKTVSPENWPKIEVKGKNIRIEDIGVATLSFNIEDDVEKLHFKDVEAVLNDRVGVLTGEYYFHKDPKLSSAHMSLKSNNVKGLTNLVGLEQGFTGKKAKVDSNVVWLGGLECFNLLGLLGKTEYQLKDGVIEDVEPGFARLLGLLNVRSIARRLSLDLKDVTTKGFAYDSVDGETHFINGKMHLKDFKLKAPSAAVELKGDIDLIEEQFNLKANVTPALGSSLPALSALTGVATPLGALAVYTLMKVIPAINEELITYKYDVTGPWDNPIVGGDTQKKEEPETILDDDLFPE